MLRSGFLGSGEDCGRIRGDFLNMMALLRGSRFGRGFIRPGGGGFDLDGARRDHLLSRLGAAFDDVTSTMNLLWNTPSVLARVEEAGIVNRACIDACPTEAIEKVTRGLHLDLGRCLFRRECVQARPTGAIRFTQDHRLALQKTYDAAPMPKIVVAVGAGAVVPVDPYVPGRPPYLIIVINTFLRLLGRIPNERHPSAS